MSYTIRALLAAATISVSASAQRSDTVLHAARATHDSASIARPAEHARPVIAIVADAAARS